MPTQSTPAVALIIPSLDGEIEPLLASVRRQTLQPAEIAVVRNVRPNGRARNQGVAETSAPILVFVDDDAVLGDEHVIANLVAPLLADPTIGVTGASKVLPPDAPPFQRWVAREVARVVHPLVEALLETNPDPPSFYSEITTTCCAMRRDVFIQVGGFDDRLLRGVDTEFFVRVRRFSGQGRRGDGETGRRGDEETRRLQPSDFRLSSLAFRLRAARSTQHAAHPDLRTLTPAPYRFVLVPRTWVYHPAPATFAALVRKQFWYGVGAAQEVRRDPSRARGRYLHTPLHTLAFLLFRTLVILPNIFLPYSFAAPSWKLGFKPLKALASYASAIGYAWGWYLSDR